MSHRENLGSRRLLLRVLGLVLGLVLALVLAAPGASRAQETLSADAWHSRIAEALRLGESLVGRAQVRVGRPGDRDLVFSFDALREPGPDETRTVFEMQEAGDDESIVSALVVAPGQPLVNWYFDVQQRRWLAVRGLLATDPWADSLFRHEDLWLSDPSARRSGSVRAVEENGRRYVDLHSEPYHYYGRVETRIDLETSLPVRVRFIDVTGAPIREQRFESVEMVDGKPFPKVVRIRDLMSGAESVVTWERVEFGRRIPPSLLDLSALANRIRKGVDPVPLDALRDSAQREPVEKSPALEDERR
jgi:hypothetical protein